MLPFSLTQGWTVVGDGKRLPFEAVWDNAHIAADLEADSDEIRVTIDGKVLVIRLDVFEQLTTHAIIAAHTAPGADRG